MTSLPSEEERECFHQIVCTLPNILSTLWQQKQKQKQKEEEEQEGKLRIVRLIAQLHRMLDIAAQLLTSPVTNRIEFERVLLLLDEKTNIFFDLLRRILLMNSHEREGNNNHYHGILLSIPDIQFECLQLLLRLFSDAFHSTSRSVEFIQYLKTATQSLHLVELLMKYIPKFPKEKKEEKEKEEEALTPNECTAVELLTLLVEHQYVTHELLLGNYIVKLTGLCCLHHSQVQRCGVYILEYILVQQQQQEEEEEEEEILKRKLLLNLTEGYSEMKIIRWMSEEAWLNLITALTSPNLSLHQIHILTSLMLLSLPMMLSQYKEDIHASITLLIRSLLKIIIHTYSLSLLHSFFPSTWIATAGKEERLPSLVFSDQHKLSPLFLLRQLLSCKTELIHSISMKPILEILLYSDREVEGYLLFVMIQLWMHCGRGTELLFVLSMENSLRARLYHLIESSQNTGIIAVVPLLLCIGRNSACVASRELRELLSSSSSSSSSCEQYPLGFYYLQCLLDILSVCDVGDNGNNNNNNNNNNNKLPFIRLHMYDLDGSLVNDVLFVDLLYPTAWEELLVLQEASMALLQPLEKRPKTSRLLELRNSLGIARYNYFNHNNNNNYSSISSYACGDHIRNDCSEDGIDQWRRHQVLTAALCCVLFMPYCPTTDE